MGEGKIGSEELRKSLPYGSVKAIAAAFGYQVSWIGQVVAGKQEGNPLIIECAEKISDAYADLGFEEVQQKILKEYASTN